MNAQNVEQFNNLTRTFIRSVVAKNLQATKEMTYTGSSRQARFQGMSWDYQWGGAHSPADYLSWICQEEEDVKEHWELLNLFYHALPTPCILQKDIIWVSQDENDAGYI